MNRGMIREIKAQEKEKENQEIMFKKEKLNKTT